MPYITLTRSKIGRKSLQLGRENEKCSHGCSQLYPNPSIWSFYTVLFANVFCSLCAFFQRSRWRCRLLDSPEKKSLLDSQKTEENCAQSSLLRRAAYPQEPYLINLLGWRSRSDRGRRIYQHLFAFFVNPKLDHFTFFLERKVNKFMKI